MRDEHVMTEDERAVHLLEPLRGEPAGPARIDVARAMVEGRRRRRSRRWSAGVVAAAVTALAAGGGTLAAHALHPAPQPRPTPSALVTAATAGPAGPAGCTVRALPADGGTGLVTAGDPGGHYLAGRVFSKSAGWRTVVWRNGELTTTVAIPGSSAAINDIDSAGTGVGYGSSSKDGSDPHAYAVRNGTVTELPGGTAVATAINDGGVIVGTVGSAAHGLPARWASAGATPARLPLPSGATLGEADGIDEDGTIVGRVSSPTRESSGYLWLPDGSVRAMPLPAVDGKTANYFWPDTISNGWVFGEAVLDHGEARDFVAMRYHVAAGTYQKLPVNLSPAVVGAPNGWVLGVAKDGPVILAGSRAVRLPAYRKAHDYVVTAFSADGRTAGGYTTGREDAGDNVPLEWTCR